MWCFCAGTDDAFLFEFAQVVISTFDYLTFLFLNKCFSVNDKQNIKTRDYWLTVKIKWFLTKLFLNKCLMCLSYPWFSKKHQQAWRYRTLSS